MTDVQDREAARSGDPAGSPPKDVRTGPRLDRVLVTGVVLVAVATAARTWLMGRTWFYLDDFALVIQADQGQLTARNLAEPYFGHLMPGGRLLARLVAEGGAFDYRIAVFQLTVLLMAAGLAVLYLLVTLFGPRPAILVPLVYFLASPFVIPAASWWAAGINHLPALAATAMALAAHVRHLREQRRSDLVATLAWLTLGLLFAELTMFAFVPLLVVSLGYFATGTVSERLGVVWKTYRGSMVGLGLLATAYVLIYFQFAWETLPSSEATDWSQFISNSALITLPVAAVGGPGNWNVAWAAQLEVAPSGTTRLLAYAAVATVVSLSALTRDRAMRAWLVPLVQVVIGTALVAKTRVLFGPGIALDLRFFTPLALGIALAVGLAFLPVLGAVESSERRTRHWLVDRPASAVLATLAFVAAAQSSAAAYPLRDLGDRSPEAWFDAVDRSLAEESGPVDLLDMSVPGWIVGPPEGLYSSILEKYDKRVRTPTVLQDDFYVLSEDGRLVRPDLAVVRTAKAPEPAGCGHPVRSSRTIALDGPVFGYGWRVRVTYTAAADTPAVISLGDVDTEVSLKSGTHLLEMPGDAEYDAVEFSGVTPASQLCVSAVMVGTTQVPATGD